MSNTLKFGNGNWATKEGSTLAYNDENNNFKPLPFSFERDSSATVVNKDGLIETVGAGMPRIDYKDNSEGALLLEPSRTNLITQSEAFDNSYWTKSGASVTSGFVSPDGTNNAYKLVEDTSTSHQMFKAISGTGKVLSFYAKADGRDWVAVNCGSNTYFNVALGTVGTVASGSEAKIESLPNGWYRCSVTETSAAYGADISLSSNGTTTSYQGDGTSGVYIFGMQLEEGSYPTSYIPTSGSVATRLADECNNGGNEQVFNDSEGVLMAEISALVDSTSGGIRRLSLSDGTNDNRIQILFSNVVGRIDVVVKSGGLFQIDTGFLGYNTTESNKIAVRYGSGVFKVYINGLSVFNDAGVSFSSISLNNLRFSNPTGTETLESKIKQLQYYNTALTDEELQALTS